MKTLLCAWFGWFCQQPQTPPKPVSHETIQPPSIKSIAQIIENNGCKNVVFGNRGKPFNGFLVGISKSYIQTKCDSDLKARLTKPPHSREDAYSRYKLEPTLPNIYTFIVGLAAQESSFKHCTGRDMSAGWAESDTAESGLLQTSLNSQGFSKYLTVFFRNWNKQGFVEDFRQIPKNIKPCTAGDAKNWGNKPDGLRFQKMSKEQPAFQIEYTALLLKETYRHHGPIVRREVKFSSECLELFEELDKLSCEAL